MAVDHLKLGFALKAKYQRILRFSALCDSGVHLRPLQEALERKRFTVQILPAGLSEDEFAERLTHRVFVTAASEVFIETGAVEEFSIIDTQDAPEDGDELAGQISQAFIEEDLKSKQPFLLRLRRSGKPVLSLIR